MKKKPNTIIIAGILILFFLGLTNPSLEEHQQRIKDEVFRQHPLIGVLGGGWLASKIPNYHSPIFFSFTEFNGEITTVGIADYVWIKRYYFDMKVKEERTKKSQKKKQRILIKNIPKKKSTIRIKDID
ncbi:MAG: hypothetical protein V3T99_05415 [Nitrososphaerales archaeon]